MARSLPGGAPWFSRGLLPLGPAGCPLVARAVTGPTATTPAMTRSTHHGRYPERSRAGRTMTNVNAAGSRTGPPAPPEERPPSSAPAAGPRTGTAHRAGAVPVGG